MTCHTSLLSACFKYALDVPVLECSDFVLIYALTSLACITGSGGGASYSTQMYCKECHHAMNIGITH